MYDADGNEVIKPVSTTGFNKPWALSEALADIVGVPVLSRPQVTKQLWVYIKKEGWAPFMFETFMSLLTRESRLQNPGNGNEIFPDEKLSKVFPVKMITSFKMAQHLKWVAVYLSVMLNDAHTSPTDLISTPSIPKRRMISSIRPLVLSPPQSVISRTHHHRPTRRRRVCTPETRLFVLCPQSLVSYFPVMLVRIPAINVCVFSSSHWAPFV